MSAPDPQETLAKIEEALALGRKIDAIKLYRQGTGVGLPEAKEAVECLQAELRAASPERFAALLAPVRRPEFRWWGWIVLALSAPCVLIGVGKSLFSLSLLFGNARVEGMVVEVHKSQSTGTRGTRAISYEPVVEYQVGDTKYHCKSVLMPPVRISSREYQVGDTKYHCKGISSSFSPHTTIGKKVWVVYKTDRPEASLIDSYFERWLMPLVIGGIGVVFAAVGVSIVRGNRVRASEPFACS